MDTPEPTPDDVPTAYPPPPAAARPGRPYTIASFVCAVMTLIILPIIFGPLGVIFGAVGRRKGDPLAQRAIIASVVAMVVGIVLAAIFAGQRDDNALGLLAA